MSTKFQEVAKIVNNAPNERKNDYLNEWHRVIKFARSFTPDTLKSLLERNKSMQTELGHKLTKLNIERLAILSLIDKVGK